MTDLRNFPQHVLNWAEAALEMAHEEGGEAAGEMAFDAVLEQWVLEHGDPSPQKRTNDPN